MYKNFFLAMQILEYAPSPVMPCMHLQLGFVGSETSPPPKKKLNFLNLPSLGNLPIKIGLGTYPWQTY